MQVSVETTGEIGRRMSVTLPSADVQAEIDKRLRDLSRHVRIKGFRPGKAPIKVIASQYGDRVWQEVMSDTINRSLGDALKSQQLSPVGMPEVEQVEPTNSVDLNGGDFRYSVVFDVMPQVTIADLSGVTIERPVSEINEEDVDEMIERLRQQNVRWSQAERAVTTGDRVTIDFVGRIDGELFEGGSANDVPVVISNGSRMIPGFIEGLIGAETGDERTIDLAIPEDYDVAEYAGKTAQFTVLIKRIEAPELPELDSNFLQQMGIDESRGIDGLRAEVRQTMARELRQTIERLTKDQVIEKLLELHQIEVPEWLVTEDSKQLLQQALENLKQGGVSQSLNLSPSIFAEEARRRVILGLLMQQIAKDQSLSASPEAVRTRIEELANAYDEPQDVIDYYYGDPERLHPFEMVELESQVVNWVVSQAQVTDVPKRFHELHDNSTVAAD